MKLQGISDGRIYATHYRSVLYESRRGQLERVGKLPNPATGTAGLTFDVRTSRRFKSPVERVVGRFPSVNVWPISPTDLVATVWRWLCTSDDGGATWSVVRELPPSSGTMGVLPSALCVHDGTIFLGEYPLDEDAIPRVLYSTDDGQSWSTLLCLEGVRHVHAIQSDPYSGDVWMTTGDRDSECRIGRLVDGEFEVLGGGSQRWRAVELAFTQSAVLWGMDCGYAAENPIFKLDRDEFGSSEPAPTRVHTVSNAVYYSTAIDIDGDRWVLFSTTCGAGHDSTAPDQQLNTSPVGRVVAASAESGFTDWSEVTSYRRSPSLTDRVDLGGRLPSANAYIFLAADPDRGVFLNPYNVTGGPRIEILSPGRFLDRMR